MPRNGCTRSDRVSGSTICRGKSWTMGTIARYIREFALTGLTSNPTIFDKAIRKTNRYDRSIERPPATQGSDEAIFFELALQDVVRAAGHFRPAFEASGGADGWVSLEVSPLLADDTAATIAQAKAASCPRRVCKPVHQDSRQSRRHSGDRGVDRRRHPDQRYPALLDRAMPGCGRRVSPRHRAPPRRRDETGALGRFAVRQPLGQGRRGCDSPEPAQPAGHRGRAADLPGMARDVRRARMATSCRRRRARAAPALGEHRDQGPRRVRCAHIEALAAPDTITTMPDETLLALADHGKASTVLRRRRRRFRGGNRAIRAGRRRYRRARRALAAGGRAIVHQVLAGLDRLHRRPNAPQCRHRTPPDTASLRLGRFAPL